MERVVVGLVAGRRYGFEVRAVNGSGAGVPSGRVFGLADGPALLLSTVGFRVGLLDVDRQSLVLRVGGVDVRVRVWWQPLDQAWYGGLEVPVGRVVVSGRRLVVNAGLLDRLSDVLLGNIVCRPLTELGQTVEPGRAAWREGTHGLFWEPAA